MGVEKRIYLLALLSLAIFVVFQFVMPPAAPGNDREMLRAAETMARAIEAVRSCNRAGGRTIDDKTDLNRTGLIGLESSSITTSLGQIEAKRTTTNPNFAGLVVKLLKEAGVGRGDAVAIGASSSFPALILASVSATSVLGARPVMILSLGASNWGANDPRFTSLEILECGRRAGVFDVRPVALAVGGENDNGADMSEEGRVFLADKIAATGLPLVRQPDLESDVRERMRLYEEGARPGAVKAFINIGGSWANMGVDSRVLKLKPGLTEVADIPPEGRRGIIQSMAAGGVPVIHLLYVKGLADRYGLPWDPVPLPKPGEGDLFRTSGRAPVAFIAAAVLYLFVLGAVLCYPLPRKEE
jgi:poly-gamma-glutamate system protein